jgi:hypothetical protein
MSVATIFIDSAEHLQTAEAELKYVGTAGVITSIIQDTRLSRPNAYGSAATLRSGAVTAQRAWVVGLAYRPTAYDARICAIRDAAGDQADLYYSSNGLLQVRRGGSTVLATGSQHLKWGVWRYIEFGLFIDSAVGTAHVRLDGLDVDISFGRGNTQGSGTNSGVRYEIGNSTAVPTKGDYGDVYVRSGASYSVITDFLGDRVVEALYPDGAGNYTDWTPDAGSNFERVDEELNDGDTSYVETATPSDRDTYTFSDLAGTVTIDAVQVTSCCKRTAADTITMTTRIGGVDYDGSAQTPTSLYRPENELWVSSPASASSWTQSEVNGAEFGQIRP